MLRLLLLTSTAFLFTACQQASAQKKDMERSTERGAALYAEFCESCHGVNMEGGMAPSMADESWAYGGTVADIRRIVTQGLEEVGMPAFGDVIRGQNLDDLVTYIHSDLSSEKIPAVENVSSVEERVKIEDWATDLDEPWGMHFIADDTALVTEKSGKLWQVSSVGRIEIKGIPESVDERQGGLLDVATDPDYANNGWVYLSYTHADKKDRKALMTKISRGRIKNGQWTNEQTLFQAKPEDYIKTGFHFGSRITFDDEGHLYFGIGDRGKKDEAQDLTRPNGKIHRIMRDGSIPEDNPFVEIENAYPSIYSYGNRNPQGTIVHPQTGVVWETEHGPRGGDELNAIKSGVNYGWPKISYGINYNGTELTPHTALPGMEQPVSQWTPSIAVCGLDVYTGDLFPEWKGRLLAGALANQTVRLIDVEGETYKGEAILIKDKGRVRDVTIGPDGAIYVALPSRIVRLTPNE
ncbi:PQQ-dependent sugar dehydrogenase [Hellea balneolensis]|uniref:PQQ-dependent sugar dehydrogenase n=1 Tax=Hellea balneolensis TaxID=287478 RepID=UPI000410BD56|nr:PQQ-dependent sugar dehydrogenase [Hellea balneolensis]